MGMDMGAIVMMMMMNEQGAAAREEQRQSRDFQNRLISEAQAEKKQNKIELLKKKQNVKPEGKQAVAHTFQMLNNVYQVV